MKKNKTTKKLVLNERTIANLEHHAMKESKGGFIATIVAAGVVCYPGGHSVGCTTEPRCPEGVYTVELDCDFG